ncbi:hypothetical protein PR001_g27508 [Phytophthora rubi]|uniref:HTH CENPB-type domain-containing protein n=1 Tax=Phytophthora rubi TaxID=129364 RepID=A0A6A3HJ82_9STRA|nr:hypothetical protein PR001_g27508 [Phytophthora rubi]
MKSAVLAFYDTHRMPVVVDTFWPGINPKSTAYKSKVRVIRRWKQQRAHIESMAAKTRTAQQKKARQKGAAKTLSDDAEMDILDWIIALRSHGVPVSSKMLELEALSIAELYGVPKSAFAASPTWMAAFLARYSLSLRAKTRQGQASAADSIEVAKDFTATVRRRIVDEGITKIYNADQTAIFFEYVPKHTVDERGARTVWVKCGGKSKERLTAMLLADNTGQKYDPWVVFKIRPSTVATTRDENTRLRHGFSRECSKVLACSGEKEPKLTPPDRKRVLRWLHAAWSGLSTTTVKGGFKHIDLLFDGRDNTPSRPVESTEVEDGLVDALQALSWLDAEVGNVCWDDDIVDRHIYQEEA